jgi:hypothetical protein
MDCAFLLVRPVPTRCPDRQFQPAFPARKPSSRQRAPEKIPGLPAGKYGRRARRPASLAPGEHQHLSVQRFKARCPDHQILMSIAIQIGQHHRRAKVIARPSTRPMRHRFESPDRCPPKEQVQRAAARRQVRAPRTRQDPICSTVPIHVPHRQQLGLAIHRRPHHPVPGRAPLESVGTAPEQSQHDPLIRPGARHQEIRYAITIHVTRQAGRGHVIQLGLRRATHLLPFALTPGWLPEINPAERPTRQLAHPDQLGTVRSWPTKKIPTEPGLAQRPVKDALHG